MPQSRSCSLCILVSLAWIGVVAALAYVNWPHLPLDMSPIDPETIKAFRAAILRHTGIYAVIALAPPVLGWLVMRKGGGKGS